MVESPDNAPPDHGGPSRAEAAAIRRSKLAPLILLLAVASVIVPVMFWQSTWFGSELADEQIREYLSPQSEPRRIQHALVRVAERMDRGDAGVSVFYDLLPALAGHERAEIRSTVGWVMGRDSAEPSFRDALRLLIGDSDPVVRRNAALGLSNFDDAKCRPALLAMLAPFDFTCAVLGRITDVIAKGNLVRVGMNIATLTDGEGREGKLPAPIDGEVLQVMVSDGEDISQGDVIVTIAPAQADMVEALRALVRVGMAADLSVIRAAVDRFGSSERVRKQAELTCDAIERRSSGDTSG